MAYIALYRRFRPIIFEEIIGQEETVRTLKNQIEQQKIAHAYLFIGSRGTGKTTTAKILSRAINCLQPDNNNPCNKCQICESILNDSNMDVIEMDAASNNGVDDIRELREIVKFPPSTTKYKVVIIDEVHMLSKGAFNALLKTLEEPPKYMVFILATTEPHKVPATIISRCQRFDFKRISHNEMLTDLKMKCQILNVEVEESALNLIIKLAEGAMRDAQSLLDQCLSYAGKKLTYQVAAEIFGKTTDQTIIDLAAALIKGDQKQILKIIDIAESKGKDSIVLLADLIAIFRVAMRISFDDNFTDSVLSIETINEIKSWTTKYSQLQIIKQLDDLLLTYQEVKVSAYPYMSLQINLLKSTLNTKMEAEQTTEKKIAVNHVNSNAKKTSADTDKTKELTVNKEPKKECVNIDLSVELENDEINPCFLKQEDDKVNNNIKNESNIKNGIILSSELVKKRWQDYLQNIELEQKTTYAMMKEVKFVDYQQGTLLLELPPEYKTLVSFLQSKNHDTNLKNAFYKTFSTDVKISFVNIATNEDKKKVIDFFSDYIDSDNIRVL